MSPVSSLQPPTSLVHSLASSLESPVSGLHSLVAGQSKVLKWDGRCESLDLMRDFKSLDVWQRAHQLTLELYRASASFPRSETYGLRAQIRAAATSIEANIAEGAGRRTPSDYGRFLDMALASTNELECEILLASDLGYVDPIPSGELVEGTAAVRRMLVGLRDAIAREATSRPRVR